jgi:hypothetical protein
MILELLKWSDAPHFFVQIFKYLPEHFVEKFMQFNQRYLDKSSVKIDRQLLITVLSEGFEKLMLQYNKLEPEFESRLLDAELADHFEVLKLLLHSDFPSDRKNGEVYDINDMTCLC